METATLYPTLDADMNQESPDSEYGGFNTLHAEVAYLDDKDYMFRFVINFNVASLAGATINSAKLRLYVQNVMASSTPCTVYRCTRPADVVELELTWNNYKASTAWTTAGGDYDTVTPTPVSFNGPTTGGLPKWFEITGLLAFVIDAIAYRSNIVSLIIRMDNETPGSDDGFFSASKEALLGTKRPELVVDYTPLPPGNPYIKPVKVLQP